MSFYIVCPSNTVTEAQKDDLLRLQKAIQGEEGKRAQLLETQQLLHKDVGKYQTNIVDYDTELADARLERQTQKSVKKQKDLMERRRRARQMLNIVNEQLKAISSGLARVHQSIPNLNEQLGSIKEGISENKTNAFSIRLPQNVSLTGSWRMALVQLTYPYTWRHVEQGHASALPDNFIELQLKAGGYLHFRVLPGYYATAEALAAGIDLSLEKMLWQDNEWVPDPSQMDYTEKITFFSMHYTSVFHRFTLDVQDTVEAVRLGQTLKYICGFDMDKESLSKGMHHAPHPPDMRAGLENLFVYCNLVEPVMVGNTRAPLLRTVGITGQVPFGEIIDLNFTNPRYLPVAQNCFSELKISINTDSNVPVPFQGGKVVAVLHFLRQK